MTESDVNLALAELMGEPASPSPEREAALHAALPPSGPYIPTSWATAAPQRYVPDSVPVAPGAQDQNPSTPPTGTEVRVPVGITAPVETQMTVPMTEASGVQHSPLNFAKEETPATRAIQYYVRMGTILCVVLIVVVGGWASLSSISGAIVSTATVVVDGNAHNVQHLEGGIVSEILVREGQVVDAGAEVARLDSTKSASRVESLDAQIASLTKQMTLIAEELSGLDDLFKKGLARKSQVLSVKRRRAEMIGQRHESSAQLKAAKDDVARSIVRAPVSGTVHQLNTQKIGTVIQAGESIMLIVPRENKLVLEARLDPRNINQVYVGQKAVVRFSAFDAYNTPELNGAVSLVSADLARENVDTPAFYTLRIELEGDEIARLGGEELRPGMPAEVFVQTNERTVLSYLLKPLSDQIKRTFREN